MKIKCILCGFVLSVFPFWGYTQNKAPYKNPNLPVEERVKDLLQRMTLEEKVDQLNMKSLKVLKTDKKGEVTDSSLVKLFAGRSIGCLESPFVEHGKIAAYSEAADHYLRTQTRLGIPAIQIAECLHGQMALGTTIFPQAIGLGSTWNPSLIKEMASVIAEEASLSGVDQALSPLFDLARDPRYGRVEECYGEDPYLVKEMGVAFVTGMQGEPEVTRTHIPEGKMACTGKHFIAYSVPEAGINLAPSLVGERTLRELHFYPFEHVVKKANLYSLMPGYHEVDGIPVHANRWLLTDVLRKEWGFNGYVFSDYGAVGMLDNFHFTAKDKSESAMQAITAGVDLEAPGRYAYGELEKLVESGKLPEAVVDSAVANVLRVKFKLGLFERPYRVPARLASKVHKPASIALSQQIAEESMVLLKNKDHILPLDKKVLKKIAVIGPNADKVQFGDYSITKNNDYGVTVLEGIRNYVGKEVEVTYAEGCGITSLSKDGFDEAARLAKESDVVVLVLGGTSVIYSGIGWGDANSKEINTCGEGYDRNELNFPGVQPELLDLIAKQGKPVVLVMVNGRPYTIPEEVEKVDAVLEAWYPGEKGGDAVCRVLFGEVNPSGRLPMTFPKTTGHISIYANHKPSGKGYYRHRGTPEKPGRDYVFSSPDPLFCLGYGLSYTTFDYSDLNVSNNLVAADEVKITCKVKNTGKRAGAEVVQLYIRDKVSSVTTPMKALKGFSKVYLNPGEEKTVSLSVPKEDLMLWNRAMERVLEPGDFEVYVGASVEDIRLKGELTID
ncbi:MAG: glycoside hydrolase family 3 N-terminal domain-containing protein [Parabacteroides sp.]|nr:glycoside hydrolase family 3 N-terminal domain-containing protein [Parabacteroides sp.]